MDDPEQPNAGLDEVEYLPGVLAPESRQLAYDLHERRRARLERLP